jgi:RNase H-fold protein (predicted Holliday junction resolvase)
VGRFFKELQTLLEAGQDVVYFNEDYSTIQAMAEFPNQSKNAQDTISAMKILSEYIRHRGVQEETI